MKKFLWLFIFMIMTTGIIFTGCKDDDDNPIENTNDNDYFPSSDGSRWDYRIQKTDSAGTVTEGTRTTWYQGTTTHNGTVYINQHDSIVVEQPLTNISYFRKTGTGVYYYLDTTGLHETIPDSLLSYINISSELQPFAFPFENGKQWTVFRMDINYGFISFTLINVQGYYEGQESVTLNLDSGQRTVEAAKVKFMLTLKALDPVNPLLQLTSEYSTYAWLAPGIGVVKWEGNATLPNSFSGGGVDFDDTTTTISTTLKSYTIK